MQVYKNEMQVDNDRQTMKDSCAKYAMDHDNDSVANRFTGIDPPCFSQKAVSSWQRERESEIQNVQNRSGGDGTAGGR